ICRSVPHTPARRIRTSTSPGPGDGRDRSITASSPGLTHSRARNLLPPGLPFCSLWIKNASLGSSCFLKKWRLAQKDRAHRGGSGMKPNTVFKRAYNRGLARLRDYAIASNIGSEPSWSQALAISRTTVRAIFSAFAASRLIAYDGRSKTLLRKPVPADFYPEVETEQVSAVVEKQFMQWILHGDCKPGQQINA